MAISPKEHRDFVESRARSLTDTGRRLLIVWCERAISLQAWAFFEEVLGAEQASMLRRHVDNLWDAAFGIEPVDERLAAAAEALFESRAVKSWAYLIPDEESKRLHMRGVDAGAAHAIGAIRRTKVRLTGPASIDDVVFAFKGSSSELTDRLMVATPKRVTFSNEQVQAEVRRQQAAVTVVATEAESGTKRRLDELLDERLSALSALSR